MAESEEADLQPTCLSPIHGLVSSFQVMIASMHASKIFFLASWGQSIQKGRSFDVYDKGLEWQWLHECLADAAARRNECLELVGLYKLTVFLKSMWISLQNLFGKYGNPRFAAPERPVALMSSCQHFGRVMMIVLPGQSCFWN